MTAEERQHRIEAYLTKVEFASLEELAQHTGASVSSVRRDVTVLEANGHVRRTHGGARLTNPRSDEFAFSSRDTQQLAEKERIARACADLITLNQTVIIDAGTTCFHVARHLENKTLHIVTNSLPVAQHFGSSQRIEVVVSGGVIYPRLGVLVGPLAVEAFSRVRADVAIMSCGGLTPDGVMNSHGLLIDIQQAMLRSARQVVLCVDHTKFGRQSISRLCGVENIDIVVSDQAPPPELLAGLEAAGVRIIIASEAGTEVLREGMPRERPIRSTPMPSPFDEHPSGLDEVPKEQADQSLKPRREASRSRPKAEAPDVTENRGASEVFSDRDSFID
ncbi:MAG TPA: DeoR/GlpR family DNA-binding transcription regulator [Candidatus Acidoferrum sp.]|nr:DeoR/GlpR family DNA-binding transcription regulator [Candidatus Acidoferrum sp.]